jgi:hypothetical protein
MMGDGFRWLWVIDLLVRLVREIIEKLGGMNGDDQAEDQTVAIRRAAARVLDPDTPDDHLEV